MSTKVSIYHAHRHVANGNRYLNPNDNLHDDNIAIQTFETYQNVNNAHTKTFKGF